MALCINQNRMHARVNGFFLVPQVSTVNSHGWGEGECGFNLTNHPCRALDVWVVHMKTLHLSHQTHGPEP